MRGMIPDKHVKTFVAIVSLIVVLFSGMVHAAPMKISDGEHSGTIESAPAKAIISSGPEAWKSTNHYTRGLVWMPKQGMCYLDPGFKLMGTYGFPVCRR